MKTNEEFRASVYARAEHEKLRIAARRQKARNASLSVAMLLLVAAIAVPLARNARSGLDPFISPENNTQWVEHHTVEQAAHGARMVLLVGTQAVVLENQAQQKHFASQYKAAMNLGDGEGAPFPAADTAKAIHSIDELSEFLADLPEAAEAVRLDYDEAFFEGNDLYAMPMGLAPQPESTTAASITTTGTETTAEQMTTIPFAIIPEATIPDAVTPSNADTPTDPAEAVTSYNELTSEAFTNFADSELLRQSADVKVLLLVPVNKG